MESISQYRVQREGNFDRDSQKEEGHVKRERAHVVGGSDVVTSQGELRIASKHIKLGNSKRRICR